MAWDRPNCRSSLGMKNIASIVIAAMDQCLAGLLRLVLGLVLSMTYVYQIMQTQILVAALSATLISSHQDNRERSSQVPKISLSQIIFFYLFYFILFATLITKNIGKKEEKKKKKRSGEET